MIRRWKNVVVKNWKDNAVRLPVVSDDPDAPPEVQDGKVADIMRLLLVNVDFKTVEDSREGKRLIEIIEKAKSATHIEMDSGTHNWFKGKVQTLCPPIFKFDGEEIYLMITEGYEKVNGSKEKKGEKETNEE